MSARAGIVVTGTEVLTGQILDRNGGWISERLRELGVEHHHTLVVGDRPGDMRDALDFMAARGMDVVVTSGGLGPTADDLTAEVVAEFTGREMVLDEPTEARIAEILRPLAARFPNLDMEAVRAANRKQAIVPRGSTILAPVGTAPGLVVAPSEGDGPTVVVLPGPPRELQAMWPDAVASDAFRAAVAGAAEIRSDTLRLFGIPESEIAATLNAAETEGGVELSRLEITTCLRRGEIEIVTRYPPAAAPVYAQLVEQVRARHADTLFAEDARTIDEIVAELLRSHGETVAVAESCTGGMLGARLTDLAGSSDYFLGGVIVYADAAKVALAGVDPAVIERVGAVSQEVAEALADGVRERLDASIGIGITGVAGPGGGSEEKPVGTVWVSVSGSEDRRITRSVMLPGGRADIRDRATVVALHLLRRLLL